MAGVHHHTLFLRLLQSLGIQFRHQPKARGNATGTEPAPICGYYPNSHDTSRHVFRSLLLESIHCIFATWKRLVCGTQCKSESQDNFTGERGKAENIISMVTEDGSLAIRG